MHETAHGLTMASYGRKIERAGVKLIAIFPYAFVDTSEAWFEPRKRRIAISAAGPISDFALGAIFSLCCVFVEGTVRDVFFQLAFAGYVGAFFNLNPWIDRDGYHMLVDYLREPGLRRRAKDQFSRRLSGRGRSTDSPVLARYSIAGLGWSILAAGFAIFMSLRYEPIMSQLRSAIGWSGPCSARCGSRSSSPSSSSSGSRSSSACAAPRRRRPEAVSDGRLRG